MLATTVGVGLATRVVACCCFGWLVGTVFWWAPVCLITDCGLAVGVDVVFVSFGGWLVAVVEVEIWGLLVSTGGWLDLSSPVLGALLLAEVFGELSTVEGGCMQMG